MRTHQKTLLVALLPELLYKATINSIGMDPFPRHINAWMGDRAT